jgi:uncharacterized RDD family membrane protein YckC
VRRLLLLLAIGMFVVVLWSDREDLPAPVHPFLAAVDVDGETLLVRTVVSRDKQGAASFTVGAQDDEDPVRLSGEPHAAAAVTDGGLAVFFEDGATILRWPEGREAEPEWRRVSYSDPEFQPAAAVGLPGGDALVVGRISDKEDTLAWGRLTDSTVTVEKTVLPVDRSANDITLLRVGDGAVVVWFESWAEGTRVRSASIPPREDETPAVLMEADAIGSVGGVPREKAPLVLVLEREGRLTAISLPAMDRSDRTLDGVPENGEVLFAASGVEPARLFAFTGLRLLSWDLDAAGLPLAGAPSVLVAPGDPSLLLLLCGVAAALVIIVLIVLSRRRLVEDDALTEDSSPVLAGYGRRFAAWMLDSFLLMPVLLIGTAAVTGIDLPTLMAYMTSAGAPADPRAMPAVVFILSGFFLYFVVAEGLFGQTLGKRALEIRAVNLDGGKAGLAAVVVRNVLRLLVDAQGGAVIIFLTARRQRFGDLLARTQVIRTRRHLPNTPDQEPEDHEE